MRRFALPCLLGALAAVVVAAAPALSAGTWRPHAVDFGARIALPAAASGGPLTTKAIKAPKRFDLLGFRWKGPADPGIRVRVRRSGGKWSRWVAAADGRDHGVKGGSDPVWAGGDDEYQLRLTRRVPGLRAHFVNVSGTATKADRVRTAIRRRAHAVAAALVAPIAKAQDVAGAPSIVPRSVWDPNDDCAPKHAPQYGKVRMAFVHHTVSANDYGPAESASIVLSICRYHEDGNGWWDIGYNFLVDRYGKVFEGRAGGITRAVVGAQAQGYNSVSTGISNIGTFESEGQTSPGLKALGRLIGWKLAQHDVPTNGKITVTSAGGSSNRYPSGTPVTFNRISGHRDGDATSCPGSALYGQLGQIRRLATTAAASYRSKPQLDLVADPSAVVYPTRVGFSGALSLPEGPSASGRTIALQRWTGRRWETWTTTTTDSAGNWSLLSRLKRSVRTRAYWGGDGAQRALASEPLSAFVRPLIKLASPRRRVAKGAHITVNGATSPWKARVNVRLQRKVGGTWLTTQRWNRLKTRRGRFTVRPTLDVRKPYRVIASTSVDRNNASSTSKPLTFSVR
jgi:hypothetical protein